MQTNTTLTHANYISPTKEPYYIVPFKYGNIAINQHDKYISGSITKYGEYSDLEVQLLFEVMAFFDGDIIEVGANIGSHTVPLAQFAYHKKSYVYAFEPQPIIFQQLCTNLCINSIFNVKALPYACSNSDELLYFQQLDYLAPNNFGEVEMSKEYLQNTHDSIVNAFKLDNVEQIKQSKKISLIKIDVEGFELAVVQGAEFLLQKHRPAIYLENDRIGLSKQLIEYLWQQGYELWWHSPPLFNENNFYQNHKNEYNNLYSINMLALPKERADIPNMLVKITDSSFHLLNIY